MKVTYGVQSTANSNYYNTVHNADVWYCNQAKLNENSNKELIHCAIDCIKNNQINECYVIMCLAINNIKNTLKFYRSIKRTNKLNISSYSCVKEICKNIVTTCLYYWIICKIIKINFIKNNNFTKN